MSRESVKKRIHFTLLSHLTEAAFELQDITLELHDTAPRGGRNLNYFGEPRSAPGEQPAIEFGTLRAAIADGVVIDEQKETVQVTVNRLNLELGILVDARPMGQMASAELKSKYRGR